MGGHPGLPMGCAPMAYVLWNEIMNHNPSNPKWINRDRFILSAGHGSMLVYSLLHLTGYNLPIEELSSFRQWGSKCAGHPENFVTEGVEFKSFYMNGEVPANWSDVLPTFTPEDA